MRRLAGEWIFRQMQMQIPKVYWRVIEESACRRWRKRQSQTRRRIVRWCPKESRSQQLFPGVPSRLASTERTSSASAPFGRQFRVSLPCTVGRSGVERVLEVSLPPEEERLLRQSAEVIRENVRA